MTPAAGDEACTKLQAEVAQQIASVELLHRIRKGQFNQGRLRKAGPTAPAIWNAVLLA